MSVNGSAHHGSHALPGRSAAEGRPKVTVGLPVRNDVRHLAGAISSILRQDLSDLELILADDASTDGSADVCRAAAAADRRIRFLPSAEHRGRAWTYGHVARQARGELFAWAAAEDLYEPELLSSCVEVLDARPDVVLCFTQAVEIDAMGDTVEKRGPVNVADLDDPVERFGAILADEGRCDARSGVIRASVLRSTTLLGPYPASDKALLAELALHGRFVEREDVLLLRRVPATGDEGRAPSDSTAGAITSMSHWRLGREYARAVDRAGRWMSARERARAYLQLARWSCSTAPVLAGELVSQVLAPPAPPTAGRWHRTRLGDGGDEGDDLGSSAGGLAVGARASAPLRGGA